MNTISKALAMAAALLPLTAAPQGADNRPVYYGTLTPVDTIAYASTIKINPGDSPETIVAKGAHVVPDKNQQAAMDLEFIAFVHYGPNTFSGREWGTGFEAEDLFNPSGLDTDQWVRTMKEAGMKGVILTVKHHDGYVLYQSRYTNHGIMSSPFEGGKGDVLRELSKSAAKYGVKLGIYLSPADLYQIESAEGLYGNLSPKTKRVIPRPVEGRPFQNDSTKFEFVVDDYNEYFLNQLFELLTEYGPIHEVWFDGAHPKRKGGQTYNYSAWRELIRTLAPEAVIFGREDVRWCGNEAGATRDTEWNVIPYKENPDTMTNFYDMTDTDLGSRAKLAEGNFLHYQYPETNTSIRAGWFYRGDGTQKVRTADDVFDIYERSVGGNSVFLLNIPPAQNGLFDSEDVAVLQEVGRRIRDTYGTDLMAGSTRNDVRLPGSAYSSAVFALPAPQKINRIVIQEPIADSGERVEKFNVEVYTDGAWKKVAESTNIGRKRIVRFPETVADSVRINVTASRLEPTISNVSAHFYKAGAPALGITRSRDGYVKVTPSRSDFVWNAAPHTTAREILPPYTVHYTLDGSEPTVSSPVFPDSLRLENTLLKAKAFVADGSAGPLFEQRIGLNKGEWTTTTPKGEGAFDETPFGGWVADGDDSALTIDLGKVHTIDAVSYTPDMRARGAVVKARILTSTDGKKYTSAGEWEFGNLKNDPSERLYRLPKAVKARWIKIEPTEVINGKHAVIAEITVY